MKATGLAMVILGVMSTIGAVIGASQGYDTSFGGLAFVVLGAFLIHRAGKKEAEQQQKDKWMRDEHVG